MEAVNTFADYLRRLGFEVEVHQVTVRPRFEEREQYGDSEDLKARRPHAERWMRFEVKGRQIAFTNRYDFPYPTIVADRANKKTPPADWYVSLSKDMQHAAIMDGARIGEWRVGTIFDRTKGYTCPVYLCPTALASFVKLES